VYSAGKLEFDGSDEFLKNKGTYSAVSPSELKNKGFFLQSSSEETVSVWCSGLPQNTFREKRLKNIKKII